MRDTDDPYDDIYGDPAKETSSSPGWDAASSSTHNALSDADLETEGDAQDNFVESKEPSELLMCLVLASAYLGLAKYCWTPLLLAKDFKLLINIEGFFLAIAGVAILIGLRPYLTPSALQVSKFGIKYKGPYWPQRKTVNWKQVTRLYLSPELVIALYTPKPGKSRLSVMLIPIVYLSDRERIAKVFIKFCPIDPIILSSPALISRIVILLAFLGVVVWVLEMLIH